LGADLSARQKTQDTPKFRKEIILEPRSKTEEDFITVSEESAILSEEEKGFEEPHDSVLNKRIIR
jgi:hypothetical protein